MPTKPPERALRGAALRRVASPVRRSPRLPRKTRVKQKLILRHFRSPGDIVMLTAAVRDLHHCHPGRFITDVRTTCPALWENNPHLKALEEKDPAVRVLDCEYPLINRSNDAPYHCLHGFIEFLNDQLGLQIKPTRFHGDIHISEAEKKWCSQVHELTEEDTPFWLVAAGGKYDVTVKWWESQRYQAVVDHFRGKILFVQVGSLQHYHPKLEGVLDLRGKTDLRQLVRLVHHAQGVLCPVTALMHLAAAVPTRLGRPPHRPCVVVAGGREPVHWEAYPHHQFIHTLGALPCCQDGGCWKARTTPLHDGEEHDKNLCVDVVGELPRCMHLITPEEVIRRIELYFQRGVARYLTPSQARAAQHGIRLTLEDHDYDEQLFAHHGAGPQAVLIQAASGRYRPMLELTGPLHRAYAQRHGISYWLVRGDVQTERAGHWNKILLMQRAFQMGFELVIWLDADTVIVDPAQDFRRALNGGAPVGMVRHATPWNGQPWHYNSGVILARNTPQSRRFLQRVWDAGPIDHPWQEQVRINEVARRQPRAVQTLAARWNCTQGSNPCRKPGVLAWHGFGPAALLRMRSAVMAAAKKY
jgi:ADP-heptose:LPS heptosyltransferase